MGIFNKKPQQPLDERTALLEKYAKAKWSLYASPVLLIAIVAFLGDFAQNSGRIYFIALIALGVFNCINSFIQTKKLRKQLETDEPMSENDKLYAKNYIKKRVIVVVAVLGLVSIMYAIADAPSSKKDSRYEEVFGKDPNDWNEADKKYVNDLFAWIDKQNKK